VEERITGAFELKGCPVNRVDFASKIHPLYWRTTVLTTDRAGRIPSPVATRLVLHEIITTDPNWAPGRESF
jgi:hypothetical protein